MEKKTRNRLSRLGLLLLAVALIGALTVGSFAAEGQAPAAEPACFEHGDVNSDGTVDNKDAIYTLYHFLFEDEYPMDQDWDFNGDQARDNKDAIFVLYHFLFPEDADFDLGGMEHQYYAPVWNWTRQGEEMTAQVTVKCGCTPTPHTLTIAEGMQITRVVRTEATCATAGAVEYTATVTYQGQTFSDVYFEDVAPTGHEMEGVQSCEQGSLCKHCDHSLAPLGHNWVLDESKSTPATCSTQAVQVYVCANCQQQKEVTLEGTLAHSLTYYGDKALENCQFVKQYKCDGCGQVFDGTAEADTYIRHTYTAALTQEATCQTAGVKTYTCADCGHSYTEEVPVNADAHIWGEGVAADGIITYTCTQESCGAAKTAVDASAKAVAKEDLTDVTELQLAEGASMAVDSDTLEALKVEQSIRVEVTEADLEEVDLPEEQKEQIGDNTVYDFAMLVDDVPVSEFDTKITISLPYTLAEGEDIDSIAVWYLDDNGNALRVDAVYSNGFVTFQVEHFSYYTVTRLTPAERCALYGHIHVQTAKAATCCEDGYDSTICQRCGQTVSNQVFAKLGHDYKVTETAPTCTKDGQKVTTCSRCDYRVSEVLAATGHDMTETRTEATCDAAGEVVKTCANGCGHTTQMVLPQLEHQYKVVETVEADCTNKGYTKKECALCGKQITTDEVAPLGHSYDAEDALWSWAEDCGSATVKLTCANDAAHTKELTAVITAQVTQAGSCTEGTTTVYTAKASFNGVVYTDVKEVTTGVGSHAPGSTLHSDAESHYYLCAKCGEKIDAAAHTWGEQKVSKAATCVEAGSATVSCTVCGYKKTVTLPATGQHTYVGGICSGCGQAETDCTHELAVVTEVDLSDCGICETEMKKISCQCGLNSTLMVQNACAFGEPEEATITLPNGDQVEGYRLVCEVCGTEGYTAEVRRTDPETCATSSSEYIRLERNGQILVESYYIDAYTSYHIPGEDTQIVDLTQEGCCTILEVGTCACGKSNGVNTLESCEWEFNENKSNENEDWWICTVCGAERKNVYQELETEDECRYQVKTIWTFYNTEGQQIYELERLAVYDAHDFEPIDYQMLGDSCEDGVILHQVCKDCGEEITRVYNWHVYSATETDLTGTGMCAEKLVQQSCLCGQSECWHSLEGQQTCNWEFVEVGENTETYRCSQCGTIRIDTISKEAGENPCATVVVIQTSYLDKAGNVIATGVDNRIYTQHQMEYTFTLHGESCLDGFDAIGVCSVCGETDTYSEQGHIGYEKQRIDLSEYNSCASSIVVYECPCGEDVWTRIRNESGVCDTTLTPLADGSGYVEACTQCGLTITTANEERSKENCTAISSCDKTYAIGDVLLLEMAEHHTQESHIMVAEFTMLGETCDDGYTIKEVCADCGMVSDFVEIQYGCMGYVVETEQIHSGEGLCGPVTRIVWSCPCGQSGDEYFEYYCNFDNRYDEQTQMNVESCSSCGLERHWDYTNVVDEENCAVVFTETYAFYLDGTLLKEGVIVREDEAHDYLYTLNCYGSSCQEGGQATGVCQRCGNTIDDEFWRCKTFPVAVYDLEDYGMCGGSIEMNSCGCGRYVHPYVNDQCRWDYIGTDPETGLVKRYCPECDTWAFWGEVAEESEGCLKDGFFVIKLTRGEEVLLDVRTPMTVEDHTYVVDSWTLMNPEGTCEDGVYVYEICSVCEKSREGHYYYHARLSSEETDLAQLGACGGYIRKYTCACGQEEYDYELSCQNFLHSTEEVQIDGVTHYLETATCQDCGLVREIDSYHVPSEDHPCMDVCYDIVTISMDGEVVGTIEKVYGGYHHERQTTAVLEEGAQSCEDGLRIAWTCSVCGESGSYSIEGDHVVNLVETLDLSQYGAVCGAELEHYVCPCGAQERYSISQDSACDLDRVETDLWMDCLNDVYQHNTEGGTWFWSNAYIMTCAVTDPEPCGLKIRMAEYWAVEGCQAVEYQIWQLGYDETDGSCDREIKVATGERRDYHNYTETQISGQEDGLTVSGWLRTCDACGSTWTEKNYYEEGGQHVKSIQECVNTLDNGKNKKWLNTDVYDNVAEDYSVVVDSYSETVYADGSIYWYRNEYSYDFSQGCVRTVHYTNSNGYESTRQEEGHLRAWRYELVKEPTCTQHGLRSEKEFCEVCGEVIWEQDYDVDPTGHNFAYNEEAGCYVCTDCGLENANGATGDIVLEDLTEEYGCGTAYVAGYWNSKDLECATYVSVILEDAAEGENDELVLTGIEFTWMTVEEDGVRAVAFMMTQALTAAAEAVEAAGYTGAYALRLSFVPTDSAGQLDYAITFETINAQ